MQITKLSLNNYCQHKALELEIPGSGVVILQGSNGKGKSNLIRSIQFALTGKAPGKRTKDRDLRWGTSSGYAEVEFNAYGSTGRIRRQLASSGVQLNFAGEDFRAATKANESMDNILGCSIAMAEKFVFIRQGGLNELVSSAAADRAKILQRLFGTEKFEKLHTMLQSELNNCQIEVVPDEMIDELTKRIEENTSKQTWYGTEIQNLDVILGTINYPHMVSEYHTKLAAYYRYTSEFTSITDSVTTTAEALLEAQSKETEIATSLKYAEEAVAGMEVEAAKAQEALGSVKLIEQNIRQREELSKQAANLAKQKFTNHPPENRPSTSESALQDMTKSLIEMQSERSRLDATLKKVAAGICPTCGTTAIVDGEGHVHKMSDMAGQCQKERTELEVKIKKLSDSINECKTEWAAYNRDSTAYKHWETKWNAQSDALLEQMRNIPEVGVLPPTEVYVATINELKSFKKVLESIHSSHNKVRNTVHTLTAQLDERTKQAAKLEEEYDADYQFEAVQAILKEYVENEDKRRKMDFSCSALTTIQAVDNRNLRDLQTRKDKAKSLVKYRSVINDVCSWFHRDRYPAAVARYYLTTLNTAWNDMLETLDVPFSAQILSDLDICLCFNDNPSAFVEDASGGQATCLSLALMLASNRLFAPDTGLLILDEPTYGADAEHVEAIADVLRQAQSYAKSTGMQIIVVTHEPALKSGFDHVITL